MGGIVFFFGLVKHVREGIAIVWALPRNTEESAITSSFSKKVL